MITALQKELAAALGSQFAIDEEIDSGGRAHVFLARDLSLYRDIAVKVFSPDFARSLDTARFTAELRRAASLRHSHIIPVHLSGVTASGLPYFTMPYAGRVSLRDRIGASPLPLADAISVLRDIAAALAHAHAHGVLHGGLQPERILLAGKSVMVADFGVVQALTAAAGARQRSGHQRTPTSSDTGGATYLAPEQVKSGRADALADVYAWGVIAYELLAGVHPSATIPVEASADGSAARFTPRPLGELVPLLSPAMARFVMSCVSADSSARPASARHLLETLGGTPVSAPAVSQARVRRLPLVAAAVLALGAVATLLVLRGKPERRAASTLQTKERPVLAVLPMSDTREDSTDAYFVSGLTEELAARLSRNRGLRVVPHSSVHALHATETSDPVELGNRLKVPSVLESRMERRGSRLLLTVVLTDVKTGNARYRETFDRDESELFALEDSIADGIATTLGVPHDQSARSLEERTGSGSAHDLLLRARYASLRGDEASIREANAFIVKATQLSPGNAAIWRALAKNWIRFEDGFAPTRQARADQRAAEARAWALDSVSNGALVARARDAFWYGRDVVAAERLLAQALRRDSTLADAPLYADVLLVSGRADSALAVLMRAARLEPMSPLVARSGPAVLTGMQRLEPLRAVCTNAVQVDSAANTVECLRMELRVAGQWREYLATCEPAEHACQGIALHGMGRPEEARRHAALLEASLRSTGARAVDPGLTASWYARMGEADRALAQLELALSAESRYLAYLHHPYFFAELIGDPRFEAFARRVLGS